MYHVIAVIPSAYRRADGSFLPRIEVKRSFYDRVCEYEGWQIAEIARDHQQVYETRPGVVWQVAEVVEGSGE